MSYSLSQIPKNTTVQYPLRQLALGDLPESLREIPDPPEGLYIRGTLPTQEYHYLCVVGSRKMSAYGKQACQNIIGALSGHPIAIISGLAIGLDSVAHEAALDAKLPTVAVLPSGASDQAIYPALHQPLAMRILKEGGAVLSEYEPDARPARWTFSGRNRIMAGLSRATLVVEASEKSGTLITARLALEYNREVLAIPHPIHSEVGAGGNRLLRLGATLIRNKDDVLEALGLRTDAEVKAPFELSADEAVVYRALAESREREDLPSATELPITRLNIALSMLLIKGVIKEELGKIIRVM